MLNVDPCFISIKGPKNPCILHGQYDYDPGGALHLWESVGMRRGFAPHFRHLDDLFAPQNLTMSTILFRSCWVPFRSPTFSACRRSFCPPNWPNLSFYSDLVGSRFELGAAHPYWFKKKNQNVICELVVILFGLQWVEPLFSLSMIYCYSIQCNVIIMWLISSKILEIDTP